MHTVKIIKVGIKSSHCNICHCISFIVYVSGRFLRIFRDEYPEQKRHGNFFFILSTFEKHDKTQLMAKFKKILLVGFRQLENPGIDPGTSRMLSGRSTI